jgi:hypothetical protein
MQFHLEHTPPSFATKIKHTDQLFLAGSCFTEQIGVKLAAHKFRTIENPNGILFNPVSISNALLSYIEQKQYRQEDLFFQNEQWGSWDHHTRFSALSPEDCLNNINTAINNAHHFLKTTNWLLLTLGSSFVYELDTKKVVANCHKVPTDKFTKRLLKTEEIVTTLDSLIYRLKQFNPDIKIIFTISPVRHLRDGFVENNRSKANLINAVHHMVDKFDNLFYFPAYELVIDDLRDYRFFAEDMVHPNYAATNYVWEKFVDTCIDTDSKQLMKELFTIQAAFTHKAFQPTSVAHQQFLQRHAQKVRALQAAHPYLDLSKELAYFDSQRVGEH